MNIQNEQGELAENEKYNIEKDEKQQKRINMALIARTSLDQSIVSSLSQQEKIQIIINIRSIHLQWLNLRKIENLEVFSKLNILYLQHNKIMKIQNLELLVNLEYLALNNNEITKVEGINTLKNLTGLNLAYNYIQQFKSNDFPQNLQLLSLKQNPVSFNSNYKQSIIKYVKQIYMLDGQIITTQEKFKLLGLFPTEIEKYAEEMRIFRRKKEEKNNPELKVFFTTQVAINQEEAINELRKKTRSILDENQKQIIVKQNEQNQNFNEKIAISKKIRSIVSTNFSKQLPIIQQQK